MFASPTGDMLTCSGFPLLNWGIFYEIPVKWSVIFLQSWTSTSYSSNSTGSSVTNCRSPRSLIWTLPNVGLNQCWSAMWQHILKNNHLFKATAGIYIQQVAKLTSKIPISIHWPGHKSAYLIHPVGYCRWTTTTSTWISTNQRDFATWHHFQGIVLSLKP